ncbi:MAG: nucleotidyltransferase [Anaerolineales bacterium]
MENLLKAYAELQQRLEEAGILSALIGGMAVGAWARARVTRDVDIKVLLHRDERQKLLDVLKTGYSFLHADPEAALRQNGVLFILNSAGVRIDVQLADIEFDEILIARARTLELAPGYAVRVCTAEDLIILKILAQRPQDDIDVERVIERQGQRLDEAYILNWLQRFERMVDDSTLVRRYQSIHTRALK